MEKVVCESCGREIPEKAKICPYCHQKNVARTGGAKSVLKKIWDAVVMLVGLVIILGGGVGKAFIMQALKNDIKKILRVPRKQLLLRQKQWQILIMELIVKRNLQGCL